MEKDIFYNIIEYQLNNIINDLNDNNDDNIKNNINDLNDNDIKNIINDIKNNDNIWKYLYDNIKEYLLYYIGL